MNHHGAIAVGSGAFSVFYALAFALAFAVLVLEGRRRRWPATAWLTLVAWSVLAGIVGSRLGVIPFADWAEALRRGAIATTTEKTFLGLVAFGTAGVYLGRKWLRLPAGVADAFALALPVGLAIARVGCVLGGCCFGTACSLPWALGYAPGSPAYDVHLARGLTTAGAASSLPVHPVQLYEILLLVLVVAVLLLVRARLRRHGSLFLLYLALQSLVRFGIEFVREGPAQRLVIGLRPLQLALLGVAFGAGLWFWLRERGTSEASAEFRPALGRSASLLAVISALLLVFRNWFTPPEQLVIAGTMTPAALAIAFAAVQRARHGSTRWAAAAAACGGLIVLGAGSDSVPPPGSHVAYYNGSFGAGTGSYQEICGNTYRYTGVGVGFSRTDRWGRYNRVEYGVEGNWTQATPGYYEISPQMLAGRVFLKGDSRWAGAGVGVSGSLDIEHDSFGGGTPWPHVMPTANLRLGPSDILFLEGRLMELDPTFMVPSMSIALGTEVLQWMPVRVGISYSGFWFNPELVMPEGFRASGTFAYLGSYSWHAAAKLTYSVDAAMKPARFWMPKQSR